MMVCLSEKMVCLSEKMVCLSLFVFRLHIIMSVLYSSFVLVTLKTNVVLPDVLQDIISIELN